MPLSDLSQDICIMARTDARATLGLDEAIDRWDLTIMEISWVNTIGISLMGVHVYVYIYDICMYMYI